MFIPSNLLNEYLNKKPRDLGYIRSAILGYLMVDPHFETNDFEEAIKYVLKQGISEQDLFLDFDNNIPLEKNQDLWNEDYYITANSYLTFNFCRERIDHLKAVAKKLYPQTKVNTTGADSESKKQIHPQAEKNQSNRRKKQIAIAVGIGLAAAAILVIAITR